MRSAATTILVPLSHIAATQTVIEHLQRNGPSRYLHCRETCHLTTSARQEAIKAGLLVWVHGKAPETVTGYRSFKATQCCCGNERRTLRPFRSLTMAPAGMRKGSSGKAPSVIGRSFPPIPERHALATLVHCRPIRPGLVAKPAKLLSVVTRSRHVRDPNRVGLEELEGDFLTQQDVTDR